MGRKKKTPKADIYVKDVSNWQRDMQKYFLEDGDEGFSPEKNKHIVEESIKKTEELRKAKHKIFMEKLGERVDAATSYILHLEKGNSTPAEKYFGQRELTRLRGQKISRIIRNNRVFLDSLDDEEFLNY